MRWTPRIAAALCVVGQIASAGCGEPAASAPPPATAATPALAPPPAGAPAAAPVADTGPAPAGTEPGDDDDASDVVEHHRHHHGGMALFLALSVDTLGVTDDQKGSVEAIQKDLATKLAPTRAAGQGLLTVLADGVAAGKVNKAKADAAIAGIEAAAAGASQVTGDALNKLHATLNAGQRAALVQKIEAHWNVWKDANAEEPGNGEPHPRGGLTMLEAKLHLTAEETQKVRANLGDAAKESSKGNAKRLDPGEVEARVKAFADAFVSDTFDAAKWKQGDSVSVHLASHGAERMARLYEAVAPVLTPDQRATLASSLREHVGKPEDTRIGALP